MLKTAEYLDKALRAEAAANRAHTPELRASFVDLARVWRDLAGSADAFDATQFDVTSLRPSPAA
jgi:hypothetical protein